MDSIRIEESLLGRKAGASARQMAARLRAEAPMRSLLDRVLANTTAERAWRMGARGERFSGWLLDRLPEGWHVFHDVPVGERGATIDHLVIGPAGVFTVNTKNLRGKIWLAPRTLLVDGRKRDYLPKAVREAGRASRLLGEALRRPIAVTPVLSIIADEWTVKERPTDVIVATPRGVKRLLLDRGGTLGPREVNEIAEAAAKPQTWLDGRP
jgi:nuclease-like protein